MSADIRTEAAAPGYRALVRTGHWRELVGWVTTLDRQGRLVQPAQVVDRVGNRVTVRVLLRDNTPPPQPEMPRVGSVGVERWPGRWQVWATGVCVVVVLVVCGVVGVAVWQAASSVGGWVGRDDNVYGLVGVALVAGSAAGAVWLVHRKG